MRPFRIVPSAGLSTTLYLTLRDAAVSLGLCQRTAERQWSYARAWLYARLSQDAGPNAD
jgi:hypothetical protein